MELLEIIFKLLKIVAFIPNIISIAFGFILGFFGSIVIELIRRSFEKKDKRDYTKKVLQALCKEIEEGINRCEGLIKFADENKGSLSRIYTGLWDSSRSRISESIGDLEVLILLHQIYYRFDLINFNMNNERFLPGAAFARQYFTEIETNYRSFKRKVDACPSRTILDICWSEIRKLI